MKTKRLIYILLFILLVVLGAHAFVFMILRNANQEISLLTQEIEELAQRAVDRQKNLETTEALGVQIDQLNSHFLRRNDVVQFIELVENIGTQRNVKTTISSLNVANQTETKKPGKKTATTTPEVAPNETLLLRLDAIGTWENATDFVHHIENLPYNIKIERLAIDKSSGLQVYFPADPDKVPEQKDEWKATIELSVPTTQ